FHNHMMIEPVLEIFGGWRGDVVSKLRRVILEEFVNSDQEGMIFTFMWAFDMPSDREYLLDVAKLFEDKGGEIYCVELVASQEIRLQRNRTENRLNNKASKRDLEFSTNLILNEDQNHRLVSREGEIPFANYLRIDNSQLSPEEAAELIKEHFGW
ncbi:MAG: shikimate kinase, partial [Acetatifactor sp.]|nr:shikimate kinase [Acetatifactor sp.]